MLELTKPVAVYLTVVLDASMAAIDSAASFKQRCHSLLGDDTLFDSLKAQGVTTSRQMAFCAGSRNQPPTDDAVKF